MLREQLNDTASEVQALLDDLEANKVTDAVEADSLVRVRTGLETIAEERVAKAADSSAGTDRSRGQGEADPTPAIQVVNQAARELAGLVLQRGIDSAREVLARESHMLAQEQATLRLLAAQSKGGVESSHAFDPTGGTRRMDRPTPRLAAGGHALRQAADLPCSA